jgi:repressor LexA
MALTINTSSSSPRAAPATVKLTDRQQQILELVQSAIARTGYPPTRAEIAAELGFRSANAAEEHLQALARKGVIEITPGASRGIRLKSDTMDAMASNKMKQYALPLPSLVQLALPLVGRVAAGNPILAQEHIDATLHVEASMFPRKPDFLLKVRGMSMRDAGILDGDLLAVQKSADAKNGQIVVARIGDEVTVKRFKRRASHVELLPENPDFQPIIVRPNSGEFQLEGIAVGLIRNTMLT